MQIERVGVIGLGNMGLPMAATLARKGFDLSDARRELAVDQGIGSLPLDELLRSVDVVVSSLPYARDVEAVLSTPRALLDRTDRRVIVVDTSTADPTTSRRLQTLLDAAGHGHLDAPVSGGPAGAAEGQLTMMIGGTDEDFADARPVIDAFAGKAVHVGPSGAGIVAKLINNMLVAAHMVTTGEAIRLGEAAGVSAEAVLQVVNAATGRSGISEVHFPKWICEPERLLRRLGLLFGEDAVRMAAFGHEVTTANGIIRVAAPGAWAEHVGIAGEPGIAPDGSACVGIDVRVKDLGVARSFVGSAGAAAVEAPGSLALASYPEFGNVILRFTE